MTKHLHATTGIGETMKKKPVPVERFMTTTPHGIEPNETLLAAQQRMQELKVRHLPVRSGGKVVGVLTERDLYVLSTFPEINFKHAKVGFAMTPDPFKVAPETPAGDVASEMAARRIGSALVVDRDDHLLGIFTDTDALTALASVLQAT
jgi:acetoin utilization protein AcuB